MPVSAILKSKSYASTSVLNTAGIFKVELSDISVPPLILQPLIENAVFHGVQPAIQGGSIYITIYRCGDWLCIDLVNSLPERLATERCSLKSLWPSIGRG